MRGGDATRFIEQTTLEECALIYNGVKYFFHGLIYDKKNNKYSYVIDTWDNDGNYIKTVFDKTHNTFDGCLALAQNEPIFNGKTFWEAENEMEWVDW